MTDPSMAKGRSLIYNKNNKGPNLILNYNELNYLSRSHADV
jgi:hypothetical protein